MADPVNVTPPVVDGDPYVGSTLTVTPGEWTDETAAARLYTWYSQGLNFQNTGAVSADGLSLVIPETIFTRPTVGSPITCIEQVMNEAGNGWILAESNGVTVIEEGVTTPPPAPAIDPALVEKFLGCTPEEATELAYLATLALQAAAYPLPLPVPLPAPLVVVALQVCARLYATTGGQTGQVVSESMGSYTYRLATAPARDVALQLTDDELALAGPWLASKKVYDISTVGANRSGWPIDWWQRDYDSWFGIVDAAQVPAAAGRLLDPSEVRP